MRYLLLVLLLSGCATDGAASRQRLHAFLPACVVLCFATVHGTESVSNSMSVPAVSD